MCFSGGSTPKMKAAPAPPPEPDKASYADQAVKNESEKAKKAKGRNSTILTGQLGTSEQANTEQKTLLSQ